MTYFLASTIPALWGGVKLEVVEGIGRCIVMEWIEGVTLDVWIRQKHSLRERRSIARQLLAAVEYVHEQMVVHRDLTYSNIMITHNGCRVKLIDFGLADADNYAILKGPAGTEGFVSPEQMVDSIPDARNDIYSLGLILRQLHLGLSYRLAIRKCFLPLEQRYATAQDLFQHVRSIHRRLVALSCLVVFLLLGVSAKALWKKSTIYQVVNQFEVGNLECKSWGGGVVAVRAANAKDSVIEIPDRVENSWGMSYRVDELEDSAFACHPLLKRIVLPDNSELHVMKHIFADSPNLAAIYFRSNTPPTLGNALWHVTMPDVFDKSAFSTVQLYVPKGSLATYRRSPWGQFKHIEEYK